ncbi:Telomere repeat-binding protein 3 [Labeo rohita]|uniref:Telomere repeat-binding protein 3 n=1 Tax=Labeo rohita TaxID=84645 RepID=A0ABQ8LTX8_LABRO|nr:Telomere repeat-binding protein 3 [Labeo rohita]
MNLAGDLRSAHYQMSPSHSFDTHITLTVAPHSGLRSPSGIALITCIQSETLYKPWTSSCHWPTPWITFTVHQPTPALRTTLLSCSYIPVLPMSDPACFMTMPLSRSNKVMQIDPPASRLPHSVTEYSATQGSNSFSPGHWPEFSLPQAPGHSSLLIVTPVCKTAHEIAAAPEHNLAEPVHKMLAKTVLRHVTGSTPVSSQVMAVSPESSKVTAVVPESSKVKAVVSESSKVKADLHKSSLATADVHEPSQATADLHEPNQATADVHEPSQATADVHEPSQVSAGHPESNHISSDLPEPRHVSSVLSEPRHVSSDTPRFQPIMMASVLDPPLMSVWAAGIPVASRSCHPLLLFPLMAVAILCVWAAHSAPEVSSVHESAPEVSSVHKFTPEVPSVHESAPEVSSVYESAPVPPEVAAPAAESPKGVEFPYALSACPVVTLEAVCELPPSPEPATEAVYELSALPATAKDLSCERPVCPVPVMEAMNELSAHRVTAIEAIIELSGPSVPVYAVGVCTTLMRSWTSGSTLVGSCSFCSALEGICSVCAALEGICSICATLEGSCSVCSALEGFCSVCSAVGIFGLVSFAVVVPSLPSSAGPALVPRSSTWTWSSNPHLVSPLSHRSPGLFIVWSICKPLFGRTVYPLRLSSELGHSSCLLNWEPLESSASLSDSSSHQPEQTRQTPYMTIKLLSCHIAIQDVGEFVSSSDLESMLTNWILCSEWMPSE